MEGAPTLLLEPRHHLSCVAQQECVLLPRHLFAEGVVALCVGSTPPAGKSFQLQHTFASVGCLVGCLTDAYGCMQSMRVVFANMPW
jgi:hypothetical protein